MPTRLLVALLAGTAMPFAFSPYHWWPLAVLAFALWIGLLAAKQQPFLLSLAFGFGWFGTGSWWLATTFHHYGNLPWIAAIGFQLLVGCVLALFPALLGWSATRLAGRDPLALLLLFAPLTVLEEWVRGHLFTGLPWTELGNLMLGTPWIGWGTVVGGLGLSLLPPLFAAALWGVTQPRLRRPALLILASGALLALFAPTIAVPRQPATKVALVQPNIAQDHKWDRNYLVTTMHRLRDLSAAHANDSDLIVWPEAATPFFLSQAPGWRRWLTAQVADWRTPLLFGGLKQMADGSAGNGAWLLTPGRAHADFVGKHHLVPFGEYVPAWVPWLHKLVPDIGDFQPATDSGVLTLSPRLRIGVLVCYESIFADEMRARIGNGATMLTVITNDAWYGHSPAAWQHLEAARMRAVESDRFVLRAANTGVSAIIAPDGAIQHTIDWWRQGTVTGSVAAIHALTPYCRHGDWPLLVACLLCVALLRWRFRHHTLAFADQLHLKRPRKGLSSKEPL